MIVWIFLLLLIAAEAAAFTWWLRKEYYPVLFNPNAPIIYSAILGGDLALAWLLSAFVAPGNLIFALLALLGALLLVVVLLFTAFMRWIIKSDIKDL